MKKELLSKIKNKAVRALQSAGLTFQGISSIADQVIVFGSCAAGCDTPSSDVDLLCVGKGARRDTGRLHLLWVDPSSLSDPDWLGTEIGGHVSKYGIWLSGKRTLGSSQKPSLRTLEKKRQRVLDRAAVLKQKWPLLSAGFKATQLRNLRLDLQRYQMLKSGDPVDPNPILDRRWTQQTKKVVWLNNLLKDDVELKRAVRAVNDKAGKSFLK